MLTTYCAIRSACCDYYAMRSASNLATRCYPGQPVRAQLTASGQSIGMRKWNARLPFNPIVSEKSKYRKICARCTHIVANVMKSSINIDCIERASHQGHNVIENNPSLCPWWTLCELI